MRIRSVGMGVVLAIGLGQAAEAAGVEPEQWTASWIAVPETPATELGVYHFRRTFELSAVPASFVVHVSADNRYQLFVNGKRVVWGPARGDLMHWHYETVDLASHLQPGRNVLAAVVWNFSELAPFAQISLRTGFMLQGHSAAERVVDTSDSWRGLRDGAYTPIAISSQDVGGYYVVGPGEHIDGDAFPWGWEQPDFDDRAWPGVETISAAASWDAPDGSSRWFLTPRRIPLMEEKVERLSRVRRAEGPHPPTAFPAKPEPWTIPACHSAEIIIDHTHLTTAFPELVVSGGRGATIELAYAETLWLEGNRQKGHRDKVEGKRFRGNHDVFQPDGGAHRLFRPLWWRTFRYLRLTVETAQEPLTIEDLRAVFTAYPFQRRAWIQADSPEIDRILDVGWRTARLCAHETYMDCPYWEQLQYAGDTRIQALISLTMTGDDRLMRQAILALDASRVGDSPTTSRHPSRQPQYITPFSLWWIGMVHDYWLYREDTDLIRSALPGARSVLAFFERQQGAEGHVGRLPWWNFVDWTDDWPGGVPPGWNLTPGWVSEATARATRVAESDPLGSSAVIDLQLLLALDWAAELEQALGVPALGNAYAARARRLRAAIRTRYWNDSRQLFADTGQRRRFSQQANALAVLARVVEGDAARDLTARLLADESLTRASLYFRHYVHSALHRVGLGDLYLDQLGPWRRMLELGVTTWPETEDPSRSECHAWGASPNFELFRTVLGVQPAAPGFARVRVRPFLGKLQRVRGAVPHPRGEISVSLERAPAGGVKGEVTLPEGVEGVFEWGDGSQPLHSGATVIALP